MSFLLHSVRLQDVDQYRGSSRGMAVAAATTGQGAIVAAAAASLAADCSYDRARFRWKIQKEKPSKLYSYHK